MPEYPNPREREEPQQALTITKQHPHSIGVIVCEQPPLKQNKPEAISTIAMQDMQIRNIYGCTHQLENKQQESKQVAPPVQQIPEVSVSSSFVTTQQINNFYPRLEESATYSGPTTTTPSPFLQSFEHNKATLLNLQQQPNIETIGQQLQTLQPAEFPVKKLLQTNKQMPQKKSSIQQPQLPIQSVQPVPQQQQKPQIQQHNQQQQFWQNQMELQAQLVQQQYQQQKLQPQQPSVPQVQLQQQQTHRQAEHQQNQLLQQAKKHSLQNHHQQIQQQAQQQQAPKSAAITMEQQQRLQQQQAQQQMQIQQQQAHDLAVAALIDPTMLQFYQRFMMNGGRDQQQTHFQVNFVYLFFKIYFPDAKFNGFYCFKSIEHSSTG